MPFLGSLLIAKATFFSGHAALQCGILFPDQRSNPHPLLGKHGVLTTGLPGKSPRANLLIGIFWISFSLKVLSYAQ